MFAVWRIDEQRIWSDIFSMKWCFKTICILTVFKKKQEIKTFEQLESVSL